MQLITCRYCEYQLPDTGGLCPRCEHDRDTGKALQFKNQIYVYRTATHTPGDPYLLTCDTIEEASAWIERSGNPDHEHSIDGTPEAWHEQTGECGGSSICDCA